MRKPTAIYDIPLSHVIGFARNWVRREGPDKVLTLSSPAAYGADYACLQALIADKGCIDTREGEQGFDEVYAVLRIAIKRAMIELQARITAPPIMLVGTCVLPEYDREDLDKLSYKAVSLGAARINAATGTQRVAWVDDAIDGNDVPWDALSDQELDAVSEGADKLRAWRAILSW